MRICTAWILLALYLNASAQTMLPFVWDCVAHVLFWHEHLEHSHNGHIHSHHVEQEVAKIAKQNAEEHSADQHPVALPLKDNLSLHLLPALILHAGNSLISADQLPVFWQPFFQEVYTKVLIPPPDRASFTCL